MNLSNKWLCAHPEWDLLNCETITQWSLQKVDGVDYSAVVNMLRIWVRKEINPRNIRKSKSPVFWYYDFAPERVGQAFESLDVLIDRINCALCEGRINGKILQIQTLRCLATADWSFNTGATYCNDGQTTRDINRYPNYVLILRVFFKLGETIPREVVVADFLPFNSYPDSVAANCGQKFSSLVDQASAWLKENYELTFCNAQSVDILVSGRAS